MGFTTRAGGGNPKSRAAFFSSSVIFSDEKVKNQEKKVLTIKGEIVTFIDFCVNLNREK